MKRIIFLVLLVLAFTVPLAQPCRADKPAENPFPSERVIKEASIYVDDLKLQGEDAEKFTMLYLDYRRKIHKAMEKNKTPFKGSASTLTDQQNDKNIRARFASSKEILDIREQYYPKFLKVMTPTQYERLMRLEQKVFEKSRNERIRRNSSSSSSNRSSSNSSLSKNKKKTSTGRSTSSSSGNGVLIFKNTDSSGRTTKTVTSPDGTVNTYIYDEDGTLIRHIETRGNKSYRKTSNRSNDTNVEIFISNDGTETTRYYDDNGKIVREIIRHGKNNI